jgi:hypothetical protein
LKIVAFAQAACSGAFLAFLKLLLDALDDAFRVLCLGHQVTIRYLALVVQADQVRVQCIQSVFGACLDVGGDSEGLSVTDKRGYGRRGDHDLECGDAPLFVDSLKENLRNDADEAGRKLCADLLLLVGRERVNDTVDCLGRACGVQSAEDKVSRFGCRDGRADCFKVTHFTDQD